MVVTGLHHYTIRASDSTVGDCVAFYTSLLNLRIGFRPPLDTEGYWLYAGEMPIIQLVISHEDDEGSPSPIEHIAFSCVNLPVTIKHLEDMSINYTTNHLENLDQFQVFIKDPAGIIIELNFSCEQL